MKDIVVRFFNMQGVLDHLQSERFSPECEEEGYQFEETETGSLKIIYCQYKPTMYTDWHKQTVAVYAAGRWAEVEVE